MSDEAVQTDMKVVLAIENTYPDTTILTIVRERVPLADPADIDQWFEDHIFELTGTGPSRCGDPAWYEATVLGCEDQPWLVGQQHEWGG